ncbi:hypothetical protein KEM54_004019, partial [Ascosphaera aggregata]
MRTPSNPFTHVSQDLDRARKDHPPDVDHSPSLTDILDEGQRLELVRVVQIIIDYMHDIVCLQTIPSPRTYEDDKGIGKEKEQEKREPQDNEIPGQKSQDDGGQSPTPRSFIQRLKSPTRFWSFGKNDGTKDPAQVTVKELGADGPVHEDFDSWKTDILSKLKEALEKPSLQERETAKSQQMPEEHRDPHPLNQPWTDEAYHGIEVSEATTSPATKQSSVGLPQFCELIDTSLNDLSARSKHLIMQAMLLLCLNSGRFSAYSEVMMLYLVFTLYIPLDDFVDYEINVSKKLLESAKNMSAEKEKDSRMEESKVSKKWKVGLASAAGAIAIGLTGGLAAPAVAAGLGTLLGGLGMGAGYLGALAGSSVLVGGLFGAYGGRMTGDMMKRYAAEVEDFAFIPTREGAIAAERRNSIKKDVAEKT